ncbi:hypothetical protein [Streptomyces sp. NPDC056244]|uniref:hypothetical protein n=1 Tax=Streptomyces sp. NPDC056244 TaxID=3345762 RepID=UPI0035E024B1
MSTGIRPSSQDRQIEEAFGAPVAVLYETVHGPEASAALVRTLELRSFLAVAEEQVAQVRDHIHEATSAGRHMDDLSADDLSFGAQWLHAALNARKNYTAALDELLRTMPPPAAVPASRVRFTQPRITAALPPAAPSPLPAGTAPARRP